MKEIIINGRYLSQPITGVQRYAHEVISAFDDLLKQNIIDRKQYKITLAVPPEVDQFPALEFIRIEEVGKLTNNLWEQISLPLYSKGKILFNPCNSGPVFGGRKQMITIHDASVFAVPQAYTLPFRLKHMVITFVMGKMAARIITDSEFSKSELIKYGMIKESRIEVIHLGSEHIARQPDAEENPQWKRLFAKPYILSVGSDSKHKNIASLIKAMECLDKDEIHLIITGGQYSKVFSSKAEEAKPWLHRLGYVTDHQLKHLYENAVCFVYPSVYEGFGLPPLEAMSCGCPVLVSNAASLPEICGDAALYFDPLNPEEIGEKILLLLENPSEREKMILKASSHIEDFNWQKTAKMVWDRLIESL
jgi:glycosyltransferase involved in cell wall biosynthesis